MTEILTYRVSHRVSDRGDAWVVDRDGHDGPLADFASKDEALRWAESEAAKIGMGRVVVTDDAGGIESEREFIDAAVRDELRLPR